MLAAWSGKFTGSNGLEQARGIKRKVSEQAQS